MKDYERHDGLGLAALVRSRQVSAAELLDAAIARTEQHAALNAVVTRLDDDARRRIAAGLPDGPFRGVPFLVKELVASVEGAATTASSRLYASNVAASDSEIVARYRRAGVAIFGKTNSPEFGLSPATVSHLYGTTPNPWRRDRSPGGSSGGSAAAVAAGIVPLAHATDGGGSIRIPASCCGLFGLKPTRGRISPGPEIGEGLNGLAVQHVVSRSVRDSAAMLDASCGPLPGDPYFATPPARPYVQEVGREPGRLRIGFARRAPSGVPLAPDCVAAVEDAARLCESLGHHVEEASPECDWAALTREFVRVFGCNVMANMGRATGGALPSNRDLVEPLTYAIGERARSVGAAELILSIHAMHRQSRLVARFFASERHDAWLTPTLAAPPLPLDHFDIDSPDVDAWVEKLTAFLPFTYPFNVTGQPAMSVPLFWNAEGLPIGVQFAARYGDDGTLFSLAAQLERARPWFDRRPPP